MSDEKRCTCVILNSGMQIDCKGCWPSGYIETIASQDSEREERCGAGGKLDICILPRGHKGKHKAMMKDLTPVEWDSPPTLAVGVVDFLSGELAENIANPPPSRDGALLQANREGNIQDALTLIEQQAKEIEDGADCEQSLSKWVLEVEAQLDAANKERDTLRKFFETIARDMWDLDTVDGGDFQDTAERLGLVVLVPADDHFKLEYDGDEMYVWAWNDLATTHLTRADPLAPNPDTDQ